MVKALKLEERQVLRIHTELDLDAAAEKYNNDLVSFFNNDGHISIGFLGLGMDGHTASLFNMDLLKRTRQYAIAVSRPDGLSGISVTRELLQECDSLIFLVAGSGKKGAVEKILNNPQDVIAAQAINGAENVELWYSEERNDDW